MSMKGVPNFKYNHIDKIEHTFAYAFMSFFWMLSCQLDKIKINFLNLILNIIVFGVIIEVLQSLMKAGRTGDYLDVIANSTGVIIGYLILKLLKR